MSSRPCAPDCECGRHRPQFSPEGMERLRAHGRAMQATHGTPKMTPEQRRDAGRKGGRKGGPARNAKLTPEQRHEATRHARRFLPRGEQHSCWSGAEASYRAIHKRLDRERGKAVDHSCIDCGAPAAHWSFDEPTGYSADLSRYSPRCRSCHVEHDRLGAAA